jgi:hypothetical protein
MACKGFTQTGPFVYSQIPAQYAIQKPSADVLKLVASAKQAAFDITTALPVNYVIDGSADYTAFIQKSMNEHAIVLMPNFPVMVNDSGLSLNSGQSIIFNRNSKIILRSSSLKTYEVLRIHNVENVSVYFPVIYGDRATHTGTEGQWGMGIAIRAAKNVNIFNPKVFGCWGDGIYVGQLKNRPSANININNPMLDNNRRNGISITAANGLTITGGIIANSNGQMPQCGIDIEPNRSSDDIDNINITNVVTFNHPKYGIVISLQKLAGRTTGRTSVQIVNPVDEGSGNGLAIIGQPNPGKLNGQISIVSPLWINSRLSSLKLPLRSYGIPVNISKVVIKNGSRTNELDKIKESLRNQPEVQVQ